MPPAKTRVPAIDGWFTLDDPPALLGSRCASCGNFAFPKETVFCRNPECQSTEFAEAPLSRTGTVWSYTDACYPPPKPYVAADPYVPFCHRRRPAGRRADGGHGPGRPRRRGRRPRGGHEVELVLDTLYEDDEHEYLVWKWRPSPAARRGTGSRMPDDKRVAVLGAGMHPWGKWGRNFVEYGLAAAGDALPEAGIAWTDVQYVAGADTIRNGYPGFIAGATFAQALGWTGARVSSAYAACASGAQAINNARAQILAGLCDVALVVGADTTPKGFFAPVGGERKDDPDWLRFHLLGATNPTYFALYARRRMELFGATEADFAAVKVKNARHGLENPYARYRKEVTAEEVLASPMVADPLRLLEICATSDGGAALVLTSLEFARRHAGTDDLVTIDAVSTVTPTLPPDRHRHAQLLDRLRGGRPDRRAHLQAVGGPGRLRGGRHRARGRRPGRGLRPLLGPRARLVRGHRPVQAGRGRAPAARRRHHPGRPRAGQSQRRPLLLRRGHPGPGHRPGVRAGLAVAGPGHGPPGRGGPGRASRPTRASSATAPRSSSR